MFTIDVDQRAGLLAFQQTEGLMNFMSQMIWSLEISENQQLVTKTTPYSKSRAAAHQTYRGTVLGWAIRMQLFHFP